LTSGSPLAGSFHGTDLITSNDTLPASGSPPPPLGPYGTALSVFNGISPSGTWSLYAADHANGDVGSLDSWELVFTTTTDSCPATPTDIFTTTTGVPASIASSATVTATVTMTNNTPHVATGATLSVALPAGNTFVSATPSQGTFTYQSFNSVVNLQLGTIAG